MTVFGQFDPVPGRLSDIGGNRVRLPVLRNPP